MAERRHCAELGHLAEIPYLAEVDVFLVLVALFDLQLTLKIHHLEELR